MIPEVSPKYNLENKDLPYHHIFRRWNTNHSEKPEEVPVEGTSEKEEENTKNKEDKLKIEVNR